MNFKKNDIVVCVDCGQFHKLTTDKKYEIENIINLYYGEWLVIKNDCGYLGSFLATRFRHDYETLCKNIGIT